jgi:adenylate cyclase
MNEIDTVRAVVTELVRLRRSFTGRDVHERINNRRVRRADKLSSSSEASVSALVRRLFNYGDPVFNGYGSALTVPRIGPIVFFPLPAHAKRRIVKISEEIKPKPVSVATVDTSLPTLISIPGGGD